MYLFSSIFGAKEEFKVEVVQEFTDLHVGMALDEHIRKIPVGSTGKATIAKNGDVVVTFDTLRDEPYTGKLRLYFKKDEERYSYFKWTESTKDTNTGSKIQTSSIFSK